MAHVCQRSVHTGEFHLKVGNVLADLCWQADLASVHELLTQCGQARGPNIATAALQGMRDMRHGGAVVMGNSLTEHCELRRRVLEKRFDGLNKYLFQQLAHRIYSLAI